MPAAAQQRQDPARISVLTAADVHAEPHRVIEAGPVVRRGLPACAIAGPGGEVDQFLGLGQPAAVRADKRQRDLLRAHAFQQSRGHLAILIDRLDGGFGRFEQRRKQPFAILRADRLRGGNLDPIGSDARAAQHHFDAPTTGKGDDQHGRALFPRTPGPARAVLQDFQIARDLDMDHQAQRCDIDAARRHVGGDADPCPLVAQGLKGVIALALAVLTRQRDGRKAAFHQRGVQMADIVARGAEQQGRFRHRGNAAG